MRSRLQMAGLPGLGELLHGDGPVRRADGRRAAPAVLVALFGRLCMGASLAENGRDSEVPWPRRSQFFARTAL
mgnify:CR=1 FL=1